MYVLGVMCSLLTLPDSKGAKLYDNLWLELLLDTYVVAAFLCALPKRLQPWVRGLFYAVLYVVAIVDLYCFWKFNSTLTPTMLMLVGETDARETREFIESYLSTDVLFSPIGWVLLLMVLHALWGTRRWWWAKLRGRIALPQNMEGRAWMQRFHSEKCALWGGWLLGVALVASVFTSWHNKVGVSKLLTASNIGTVEHLLTYHDHAQMYLPIYRLVFSYYSNVLAEEQVNICIASAKKATVDSCSFRSPTIVLIIGESYGRHHSQQYGYEMPTTPRQIALEHTQMLTPFSDVVSCWNLTSFVFKNVLSLHTVGEKGEWCDYPLFPELFRKAGYEVTFLTNQFLPKKADAVYDFSGGFFLNDPTLSEMQFDHRNSSIHRYDDGLLADYDTLVAQRRKEKKEQAKGQLYIFHLLGQHVNYRDRYPKDRRKFRPDDYIEKRPELSKRQRYLLADYDNAVLYNDSIVGAICKRFEKKDAIVIYMPDHGEECYEPGRNIMCRDHSSEIDWPLAHYEFEIPFWIYCTHKYAVRHPEVFMAVKEAKDCRFMTDALPHTLLWLAGIHTRYYKEKMDVLSPNYDNTRPRILKGKANYDKLRDEHEAQQKKEKQDEQRGTKQHSL